MSVSYSIVRHPINGHPSKVGCLTCSGCGSRRFFTTLGVWATQGALTFQREHRECDKDDVQ